MSTSRYGIVFALCCALACHDPARPAITRSVIRTIEIVALDSSLLVGHSLQLQVIARDATGQPVSPGTVAWLSDAPDQLTMSSSGQAFAPVSNPGGDYTVIAADTTGTAADTFVVHVVLHGWVRWRASLGGMPLMGAPAQSLDGTIYVLGQGGAGVKEATLFAVSPSGEVRWQRRLQEVNGANYPMVGTDGAVYVVGQHVWAFDADGSLKWAITSRPVEPLPNLPSSHAGALAADGTLYAAMGYDLFALRAADGDTLWIGPRANDCGWLLPPSVSADGRTAYIKNTADSLYAFDAATGTIRWGAPDPSPYGITYGRGAAVAGARLIVPSFDRLQELDSSGVEIGLGPTKGAGVSEPAIGADGTLYAVRTNPPGTIALDPINTPRWTRATQARWTWYGGPALAAGGTLYIAGNDGFYALQLSDTGAAVRWRYPPDPADSLVFVGAPLIGPDGTVYTFTSCDFGRESQPCSDELIAFWEDKPVDPDSPWPMWRHDARRSGQAHR